MHYTGCKQWIKMAFTGEQQAFCVLEFSKLESVMLVQRKVQNILAPFNKSIHLWYKKFKSLYNCAMRNELVGRLSLERSKMMSRKRLRGARQNRHIVPAENWWFWNQKCGESCAKNCIWSHTECNGCKYSLQRIVFCVQTFVPITKPMILCCRNSFLVTNSPFIFPVT